MAGQIDDVLSDALSDSLSDPGLADADRRKAGLIAAAQARWVDALTDLGGRNTLLYYKDRRAGTLDLARRRPGRAGPLPAAPGRPG